MITLEAGRLHFRFPEVHERAHCSISFERTLRDSGRRRVVPLAAGSGQLPLVPLLRDTAMGPRPAALRRGGAVHGRHRWAHAGHARPPTAAPELRLERGATSSKRFYGQFTPSASPAPAPA